MEPWYLVWCATQCTTLELSQLRKQFTAEAYIRTDQFLQRAVRCHGERGAELRSLRRIADAVELALRPWKNVRVIPAAQAPGSLRLGSASPWFVVAGAAELVDPAAVAIVGTRHLAPGDSRTPDFVRRLIADWRHTVVSGGALGVDTLAQDAALAAGVPIIVVLGGGLGHAGPIQNVGTFQRISAAGGAVLSDRSPLYEPRAYDFPRRNRIIAAISAATVVVRAPVSSGALNTANHARELLRPVLAVPGDPDDPNAAGCHDLLRRGATICAGARDLHALLGGSIQVEIFGTSAPHATSAVPAVAAAGPAPVLSDAATRLVAALADGRRLIDELVASGLGTSAEVNGAALELELEGLAVCEPGGWVRATLTHRN